MWAVVSLWLVVFHLGNASVLRSTQDEPVDAHAAPMVRTHRCLAEPLPSIRKVLLDALNLQTEPFLSVPGMGEVRAQWTKAFEVTHNTEAVQTDRADNSGASGAANSTLPQCCKFASQIFIKDLGWDNWIIYPESFTYVQCSMCDLQGNPQCPEDDPSAVEPPPQKPCCEATTRDQVTFLYFDETGSLVIASVPLTGDCGCSHGDSVPNPPGP